MTTARKLPSGSWRCQVYDYTDENGKRIYKSFTSNDPSPKGKREAELQAAQYAIAKNAAKERPKYNALFEEALSMYISEKEAVLSPATIRGYRNIETVLCEDFPSFCKTKLCDINQRQVQNVINVLAITKSPKTVRNYHGLISAVLGSSIVLNTTMPQAIVPNLYIPSDTEIKKLVLAVKNTELEIPVLLGAFCMMRRGEICGLSMNDIDNTTIHVHHSLVLGADKQWHLKAPKTKSSDRYIEAPQFVIDRIREMGHITTLNPHSITIMFGRILERNNIPHFRFHDLRHYSASIRHALGIPDAYIMEAGGWCSDKVLKAVYRHAMSDRKKEMSDKANNHFDSLF